MTSVTPEQQISAGAFRTRTAKAGGLWSTLSLSHQSSGPMRCTLCLREVQSFQLITTWWWVGPVGPLDTSDCKSQTDVCVPRWVASRSSSRMRPTRVDTCPRCWLPQRANQRRGPPPSAFSNSKWIISKRKWRLAKRVILTGVWKHWKLELTAGWLFQEEEEEREGSPVVEELKKKNQLALESSAKKSQEILDLQSEKSRLEELLTARLLHEHV